LQPGGESCRLGYGCTVNRQEASALDRFKSVGARACTSIDLIAIGFSRSEADAVSGEGMARKILTRYGSIRGVGEASNADLSAMTGLDNFELVRAQALIELGRRFANAGKGDPKSISQPEDVISLVVAELEHLRYEKREHFFAVLLDAKSRIIKIERVHIGTLSMSLVGPREIFRAAVREGASSLIVAHNHPSGDPSESPEDVEVTRRLAEIGRMLDIPLLDHVIIGERNFVSLHRKGII
jgi:DNA repair protein RadC